MHKIVTKALSSLQPATQKRKVGTFPHMTPRHQSILMPGRRRRHKPSPVPQRYYHSKKSNHDAQKWVKPYSESLPLEGYEYCEKCQIRLPQFQKPVGGLNPCVLQSQWMAFGLCRPARQYYRKQFTHMIFLGLFCFVGAPIWNQAFVVDTEGMDDD